MKDEATTWRAGLAYVLDFGLAPYVSYAEFFLPQAGVDPEGVAFVPTTGRQVEAGVRYQLPGQDALLSAAVYDIRKKNVPTSAEHAGLPVLSGPDRRDPIARPRVAGGGELCRSRVHRRLCLQRRGDHQGRPRCRRGRLHRERRAARAGTPGLALGRLYPGPGPAAGLTLGGGVRYVGSTFADDANTIENDPYTLADAAARYDLGAAAPELDGAVLALNVTNLFGTDYQTCFTAFADCTNGAPRTVIGSLTYQW